MSQPTLEELKKIQNRDRVACEQLVKNHYRLVYSLHYRFVGNPDDAADLTQDTFRIVWERIQSFRGDADFSTWLYRIAHNAGIDWHRKNQRLIVTGQELEKEIEPEDKSSSKSVSQLLIDEDERLYVSQQIKRLAFRDQEVIVLHYFQQLTIQQTAEVLGIAVGTAKWRLNQALGGLRRFLKIDSVR